MTAQLAAPSAVAGYIMMTPNEARVCVARIKAGLEDIRVAGLELEEREGWKALGYGSWRECAHDQFGKSLATVYRQLRAAKVDRDISQVEKNPVRLPTVQSEELARLPDPESRQTAYLAAKEATGGNLTQAAVKAAVNEQIRPSPKPSVRAERASSDSQDVPDELAFPFSNEPPDLGIDAAIDEAVNQEPFPQGQRFCSDCGDHYRGITCPCKTAPAPADSSERSIPNSGTSNSTSRSPAVRSGGLSGSAIPAPAVHRPILVDGIAPVSAYPTPDGGIDFVDSNYQGEQFDEFDRKYQIYRRERLAKRSLSGEQPADPKVDLTEAMAQGRTILEIADAITEGVTLEGRVSLLAVLADRTPPERLGMLAHRVRVALRAADGESADTLGQTDRPLSEIEAAVIDELATPGRLTGLVARLAKRLDRKDQEAVAAMLAAQPTAVGAR